MTVRESYTLTLPYTLPPLSLNDRHHWAVRHRKARGIRQATAANAHRLNLPRLEAAEVTLHYRPRDNRRRDADNLMATLKPAIDGLRDAGVLDEDDSTRVIPRVRIHPKGLPALWLTVEPREREET